MSRLLVAWNPFRVRGPQPVPTPVADRLLRGPLTVAFSLLAVFQFACWLPGYLTWPIWADHDVFATLAMGWDAGRLPYRDLPTTNFPGAIYQAWLIGKLFGWGGSQPTLALDAAFVATFAIGLVAWSRIRLGSFLPGVVAACMFFGYYFDQGFTQIAQRDWHATGLTLLGLLVASGSGSRRAGIVSAVLLASAFSIRPQVVLFIPALLWALRSTSEGEPRPVSLWAARSAGWLVAFSAGVGLLFVPVVWAGVAGDMLRELRLLGGGDGIYQPKTWKLVRELHLHPATDPKFLTLAAVIGLLACSDRGFRRTAAPFALALAGVWFYKPLSPFPHAYLDQPFRIVLCVLAGVAVAGLLRAGQLGGCAAILAVAGLVVNPTPRFAEPTGWAKAVKAAAGHPPDGYTPAGYVNHPSIPPAAGYAWADYATLIDHLRATPAGTPVANLFARPAAVNGPAGRPSPLHAESLMWLFVVGRDDANTYAAELAAAGGALVVWVPAELDAIPKVRTIAEVVRSRYRPRAKFGPLEVWERCTD
jgi:hypothetical protein